MGDCCSTGKRQNNNDEDATKIIGSFIERAPNKKSELRVIQDNNNMNFNNNLNVETTCSGSYTPLTKSDDCKVNPTMFDINQSKISNNLAEIFDIRLDLEEKQNRLNRSFELIVPIPYDVSKTNHDENQYLSYFLDNETTDVFA